MRKMDKHITAPFDKKQVEELHAGDYVYISGVIYSARDAAHKRMYDTLIENENDASKLQSVGWKCDLLSGTNTCKRRSGHWISRTNNQQSYGQIHTTYSFKRFEWNDRKRKEKSGSY